MPAWLVVLALSFLVLDSLVVLAVLRLRGNVLRELGDTPGERRRLTLAASEMVGRCLDEPDIVNAPALLASRLAGLVPEIEALARVNGHAPRPEAVRFLLTNALVERGIPPRIAGSVASSLR
jgi:hypothetical protein